VSTIEDRVRAAFRADAETVQPDAIPGPPVRPARPRPRPSRPRWVRFLIPLTAATAVAAVVVGVSMAVPAMRGPGHRAGTPASSAPFSPVPKYPKYPLPTSGPLPAPVLGTTASRGVPASTPVAGVPRYYVTNVIIASTVSDQLVVRDTATGSVVGRISPPGSDVFASIAAVAGDRTFVTTLTGHGCTSSRLYQFRLNDQGQPGPLEPLHVTVPGSISQIGGDLAVTPDGRTIAYNASLCGRAENEVGVIDLATRHVATWAAPVNPRDILTTQVMGLSLSSDGSLLGFETFSGARVLNTGVPGGSVFQRGRMISPTALWAALGTGDATLYTCTVSPHTTPLPRTGGVTYAAAPLAGGQPKVIAGRTGLPSPQCWASLDPSGGYLLVEYPAHGPYPLDAGYVRAEVLNLRTGRLTPTAAASFSGPEDIAW
jgi:hypothetical protein